MDLLSVWHTWLEASYAPATVELYWGAVRQFAFANPIPIVAVTEASVAAWIETFPYRSQRRVSYLYALRSLFRWLLRNGHIERDPTAAIRVQMPEEKEPRSLTREEYAAVRTAAFAHCPYRGFAVELLYFTGGRIGEVCALTWDRVVADGVIFARTKGGKERKIPWSDGLHHAIDGLHGYFGEQDRVLPRAEQTVWAWVRDAGIDAGIDHVHPHLFRSTFGTNLDRGGAKLPVTSKLMGHAKITTTQRYRAIETSELGEAVQLL